MGSTSRSEGELFAGYIAPSGAYDEVFVQAGEVRPAWRQFSQSITGLTRAEYLQRWEEAQKLLRQNSLANYQTGDPAEGRPPWQLDAFPLVIGSEEWRSVASGLEQRAKLLDLVARDLLGPQRLVRDGTIPAEVLYRHPGFQLPYCNHGNERRTMIHLYAADMARSPDGRWLVLEDRTEAPSGLGFALENRIALSRVLPDVIHRCGVERLANFFIALREHIRQLAPSDGNTPRVVVLSEASEGVNYFEDAFLARYLGYTLADIGDLTIRKNRVYLKTLGGLSPVDVLVRRPNSERCDPLELSAGPSIGLAGLLQTVRRGHVAIANGMGSGLVESPLFCAFWPRLAEKTLGQALQMPSVLTWWCGESDSLEYVLAHLDSLVVRPAYRRRRGGRALSQYLGGIPRDELANMIRSDPGAYIARQRIARSVGPAWSDHQMTTAHITLRAFAVAQNDSYRVMPGGLARLATQSSSPEQSLLLGERSKDCWVLADGPVEPVTLLSAPDEEVELRRGGVDLPSRAAEHFFWLGRQAVRAETLARLIRSVARRVASEEASERIPEFPHLLRMAAELGQIEPGYVVAEYKQRMPALENALPRAVFDERSVGSLRAIVTQMATLAAPVRDLMSLDTWRIIRTMDEDFRARPNDGFIHMLDQLDALQVGLAAFAGQVAEGMTRTHAWRFLDLGCRIERGIQVGKLLRAMLTSGGADQSSALEALLEIADSVMTYRSRYNSRFQLGATLDLLVTDETNPRSAVYQVIQCSAHVQQLPQEAIDPDRGLETQSALSLLTILREACPQELARKYLAGSHEPLEALLQCLATSLPMLSDAVSHRYFFHSGPITHLSEIEMAVYS